MPCSGGFRLRWREAGSPPGGGCRGPWAQTESCNMGPCPGNGSSIEGGAKDVAPGVCGGFCCLSPWRCPWKAGDSRTPQVGLSSSGPQERAVRPGTPCPPLTVPTSARGAVPTSGTAWSVCRDPAAQVARPCPPPGPGTLGKPTASCCPRACDLRQADSWVMSYRAAEWTPGSLLATSWGSCLSEPWSRWAVSWGCSGAASEVPRGGLHARGSLERPDPVGGAGGRARQGCPRPWNPSG